MRSQKVKKRDTTVKGNKKPGKRLDPQTVKTILSRKTRKPPPATISYAARYY